MLQIQPSRSGPDYAFSGTKKLHSPYDPVKEAKRFLASIDIGVHGSLVICGPGLGYLVREIQKAFPQRKLLALFYSDVCRNKCDPSIIRDTPAWSPNSGESAASFLNRNLELLDIRDCKIVEWKPAADIFTDTAENVHAALRQVFLEKKGSFATVDGFGQKWLRNAVFNYLFTERFTYLNKTDTPILIAASGPSLEKSFHLLRKHTGKLLILALPSSIHALLHNNIIPDLIMETDPGFFAQVHTHLSGMPPIPRIKALTACRDSHCAATPLFLFHQGGALEKLIAQQSGEITQYIPAHGTVAGTALYFASALTSGPVFIAGMDFAWEDISGHVRPHAFDRYMPGSRLAPELSQRFHQRATQAPQKLHRGGYTSESLRTYAGWFHTRSFLPGRTVYRISPSEVPIESMRVISNRGFEAILKDLPQAQYAGFQSCRCEKGFNERLQRIEGLLHGWIASLEESQSTGFPSMVHDLFSELSLGQYSGYRLSSGEKAAGLFDTLKKDTVFFLRSLQGSLHG